MLSLYLTFLSLNVLPPLRNLFSSPSPFLSPQLYLSPILLSLSPLSSSPSPPSLSPSLSPLSLSIHLSISPSISIKMNIYSKGQLMEREITKTEEMGNVYRMKCSIWFRFHRVQLSQPDFNSSSIRWDAFRCFSYNGLSLRFHDFPFCLGVCLKKQRKASLTRQKFK